MSTRRSSSASHEKIASRRFRAEPSTASQGSFTLTTLTPTLSNSSTSLMLPCMDRPNLSKRQTMRKRNPPLRASAIIRLKIGRFFTADCCSL